ncbi:pseudouridine synthase [Stigmatella sp. ncwal1]|uniref:Pseudouridine synthase n=1 Tax=Stigmatella ashevillensis TaxID=2995309 RepID=A0ABT5DC81_9BACT|nr:pseudouridine synthase [Stigmatella ashevillena]MDC0709951.1 pseudouridine synthase [Stigmatella ashevillena]
MQAVVTYFDPQPTPSEVPARLANPFAEGPPHPLARRAAEALQERLRHGDLSAGLHLQDLEEPGRGKMFGVLAVAAPDGRMGYLCGFSGMLDGRWHIHGFAPPLFDEAARNAFWPAGEAELRALDSAHAELLHGAEPVALRTRLDEMTARHGAHAAGLQERHEANRRLRHEARQHLAQRAMGEEERRAALHALGQESRADAEERRRMDAAHHQEREVLTSALRALDVRRAELEHLRAERSRQLWQQIAYNYVIPNARGEERPLGVLFAPEPPPGGAGDCAAPKLLAQAYRHHLKPLALAEFWWGAPPLTGERRSGMYYPACRSKCGAVLPYMLEGLPVDPLPPSGRAPGTGDALRLVYEDPWLLAVDKPCGLLSVPGRHSPQRDSVLTRLRRRASEGPEPLIVHPLESDTSGLLLAAKDAETHVALQRQFARREADKHYTAWLEGSVPGDHGLIELPLRAHPEDRPRQIVDPVHGKRAVTEWRVMQRNGSQTQVVLLPRTGLPHQLRVHAAHPLGLNAPIAGDRLYGNSGGTRLMLHAGTLTAVHPRTGERLHLECPAPF